MGGTVPKQGMLDGLRMEEVRVVNTDMYASMSF